MKVREFIEKIPGILISKVIIDRDIITAVIDSRKVVDKAVFFAIKGEHVDGNDFANDAAEKGASLVIMSDKDKFDNLTCNKVLVKDVVETIALIGTIFFNETHAKKIVITGSFGKTSTKEILKSVLRLQYKTHYTSGNYNNKLGVGLTGSSIPDDAEMIVLEIGSNAEGEIAQLAQMIKPDIAIVTNVGHAHIGKFGSIDRTINEKLSVADSLPDGGLLIIPYNLIGFVKRRERLKILTFGEDRASDISINKLIHHDEYIEFMVSKDSTVFTLNTRYIHIATNALPVILLAKYLSIDMDKVVSGLADFSVVSGRGNVIRIGEILLIDDAYNAGMESVIKSVESLSKMYSDEKVAILGEIAEIEGHEIAVYNAIYELPQLYTAINFILIGESYTDFDELKNCKIFKDKQSAMQSINEIDKGIVLVKASHSKKFDEIVNILKSRKA